MRCSASSAGRSSRPRESRALGHLILAYLELAHGRWEQAQRELEVAGEFRAGWALEHRALISVLPFVPATDEELRPIRDALSAWDAAAEPAAASRNSFFAVNDELHSTLRLYLLGLVEARLRESSALRYADEVARLPGPPDASSLTRDMAESVRARLAWSRGEKLEALETLQRTEMRALYQRTISSPFFAQSYERFSLAELLGEAGRSSQALDWYSSFTGISYYDVVFLAPSHFRRAAIYEELGQPERAAEHYRRFLELWKDSDRDFRSWVEEAEQQLRQLGG